MLILVGVVALLIGLGIGIGFGALIFRRPWARRNPYVKGVAFFG